MALRAFFESYPDAIVEIGASNDKRLRVYNGIVKRRFDEIKLDYLVQGIVSNKIEDYHPEKFYQLFVIQRRRF